MTVTTEAAAQNGGVPPSLSWEEKETRRKLIEGYLDSPRAAGQAAFEVQENLNGAVSRSTILRHMHLRGARKGRDGLIRMPGRPTGPPASQQKGKKGAYRSYEDSWKIITEAVGGHRDLTPVQIHEITGVPQSTVYKLLRQNGVMASGGPEPAQENPPSRPADAGAVYSPLHPIETAEAEIVDGPPPRQVYAGQLIDGSFLGRDERGQIWIWRPDRLL